MAKTKKEEKKKNKMSSFAFLLFCLVIFGAFSSFIVRQAAIYNSLRAEYYRIQANLEMRRDEYHALSYQAALFDSDAYIIRLARDRFGWARPNEIVFRERPAPNQ